MNKTVETALRRVTGLKRDPELSDQDAMRDLAVKVLEELNDATWKGLSDQERKWSNDAIRALNAKKPIPDFYSEEEAVATLTLTGDESEDEVSLVAPDDEDQDESAGDPEDLEEEEADEDEDDEFVDDEEEGEEEKEEAVVEAATSEPESEPFEEDEVVQAEEAKAKPAKAIKEERVKMRTERVTEKTARRVPLASVAKAPKARVKARTRTTNGNGHARANGHEAKRMSNNTKTAVVAHLLKRKNGCTRADILEATGWPSVSVQAIAKACGLKLRKHKEKGTKTTYFGS